MTEAEISIIVPVYNVEKYINRCVDSIISQTYKNIEIILVDDGSFDMCPAICDNYAMKDSRVSVIHKQNGGLSDARNAGIEAARGRYIGFVDGDDCIKSDMYERLYDALTSADADISISNFIYVDEDCTPVWDKNINMPDRNEVISGMDVLERTLDDKGWYYVTVWNRLYKKEIFENVRFPVGKLHEDEFVAHGIYGNAKKVACIKYSGYMYVQRDGSIMGSEYSIKNLDAAIALTERFDYCMENGMQDCAVKLIQRIYGMLLDAYVKLDMRNKQNKNVYHKTKKIYLTQCKRVRKLINIRDWIIDVIIFGRIPIINKTAAILNGRRKNRDAK